MRQDIQGESQLKIVTKGHWRKMTWKAQLPMVARSMAGPHQGAQGERDTEEVRCGPFPVSTATFLPDTWSLERLERECWGKSGIARSSVTRPIGGLEHPSAFA